MQGRRIGACQARQPQNQITVAAEKQPHTGHRARVRARFLREGLDAFEDHNALELLLFYAVPQRDTNELAHKLINAFGSLSAVFDAPVQSLMQVGGISENTAVLIKLIPAMYGKYVRSKQNPDTLFLKSAEAAGAYFTSLFAGKSTEHFYAVCMNHKCKVLKTVLISDGTASETPINTRKLLEAAVHTGASDMLLAHNHPEGVAAPSVADVEETAKLFHMLKNMQVQLNDHFIVAGDEWFSMASALKFQFIFK